tara:strand:+ start:2064 stop:2375 length:312 start_codon:yes stop_codon:yes gene_type:complete
MRQKSNRALAFEDRPNAGVGNNNHIRNIEYIRSAIKYFGGEANTHQIYDWLNENTRNGIGSRQLPQVLKMGPFDSVGFVRVKNTISNSSNNISLWRIRGEKNV